MVDWLGHQIRSLGNPFVDALIKLGFGFRFFLALLWQSPSAFRRFRLIVREIYFSGVLSLVIITVSGLFVGMVLCLQGYDNLQRYGASERAGVLVALSCCASWGPWWPVCCSPAARVRPSPPKSA